MDRFTRGTGSNPGSIGGTDTHFHGDPVGNGNGRTENYILTESQIPVHNHGVSNGDTTGNQDTPHRHLMFANQGGGGSAISNTNVQSPQSRIKSRSDEGADSEYTLRAVTGTTLIESTLGYTSQQNENTNHAHSLTAAGGGEGHNHEIQPASNIPSFMTMAYIIRTK